MKKLYLLLLVCGTFLCLTAEAKQPKSIELPLHFDRYYTYDEINQALKKLHDAYPSLTAYERVGESEEGRAIYSLTINNPKTGTASEKCGVYVDGNIHGNEIQAGEVCLYFANYLLSNAEDNEDIKSLLDTYAYYIIPVVNVDGRYHFMADANTPHSNRSIRISKDDDGDGLFDEDPSDDLDGDGSITQMRIKDPFGQYRTDPKDPRLLVRCKEGEKGEYTILGNEGIDNDGDGRFNEDGEGYVDGNRNWGFNWQPNYIQRGAGDFPLSAVGLRSIAQYLNARPNIMLVFAFHNSGGMWLGGSSHEDMPIPNADKAVFQELGHMAEKITPGYRYMESYELYSTFGDFTDHTYNILGAFSFVGELFISADETFNNTKTEIYKGKTTQNPKLKRDDLTRERLQFSDHLTRGNAFAPWKEYEHPTYGTIEIGGWVKWSSRMPDPFMLPDLVHRNAMTILSMTQELPQVSLELLSKESMGNGLTKVRIRAINKGKIPTMAKHAIDKKLYAMDCVECKNATVITGGEVLNVYTDNVQYKEFQPEKQNIVVPGESKKDLEFIVSGKGEVTFVFTSQKVRDTELKVKL